MNKRELLKTIKGLMGSVERHQKTEHKLMFRNLSKWKREDLLDVLKDLDLEIFHLRESIEKLESADIQDSRKVRE